jgi:hypothetical protein
MGSICSSSSRDKANQQSHQNHQGGWFAADFHIKLNPPSHSSNHDKHKNKLLVTPKNLSAQSIPILSGGLSNSTTMENNSNDEEQTLRSISGPTAVTALTSQSIRPSAVTINMNNFTPTTTARGEQHSVEASILQYNQNQHYPLDSERRIQSEAAALLKSTRGRVKVQSSHENFTNVELISGNDESNNNESANANNPTQANHWNKLSPKAPPLIIASNEVEEDYNIIAISAESNHRLNISSSMDDGNFNTPPCSRASFAIHALCFTNFISILL